MKGRWKMIGATLGLGVLKAQPLPVGVPAKEWIDEKGYLLQEKQDQFRPLLKETGFLCPKEEGKGEYRLPSWHIDDVNKALQGKIWPQKAWLCRGERWEMNNPAIRSRGQALSIICHSKDLLRLAEGAKVEEKGAGFLFLGCRGKRVLSQIESVNAHIEKHFKDPRKERPTVYLLTGTRSLTSTEKDFLHQVYPRAYAKLLARVAESPIEALKKKFPDPVGAMKSNFERQFERAHKDGPSMTLFLMEYFLDRRALRAYIPGETSMDPQRGTERATTASTIKAWAECMKHPKDVEGEPLVVELQKDFQKLPLDQRRFLLVSEAPYIDYQWQCAQNVLDHGYPELGVVTLALGKGWYSYPFFQGKDEAWLKRHAAVNLDTLARLIYEIQKAFNKALNGGPKL